MAWSINAITDTNTIIKEKQKLQETVEGIKDQTSTEQEKTDLYQRPDTIQEPEENENIKTIIEQLEAMILFDQYSERKVYVGANLSSDMRGMLIEFLKANIDHFTWSHSDMTGIPPDVMTHKLNEDPSFTPVKQKKRQQGAFKNQVIQDEVQSY